MMANRFVMVFLRHFLAAAVFCSPGVSNSGGVEKLRAFSDEARSGSAEFTQTTEHGGRLGRASSGTMSFSKPGKFRWEIVKPAPQLVVGDGVNLWIYDPELRQATKGLLGDAMGSSPAAVLAGSGELEKNFTLREDGESSGMSWVEARPKKDGGGFDRMRAGMAGGVVREMEIFDNFGQKTKIVFGSFTLNRHLPASLFRFTPPAGAEVVENRVSR